MQKICKFFKFLRIDNPDKNLNIFLPNIHRNFVINLINCESNQDHDEVQILYSSNIEIKIIHSSIMDGMKEGSHIFIGAHSIECSRMKSILWIFKYYTLNTNYLLTFEIFSEFFSCSMYQILCMTPSIIRKILITWCWSWTLMATNYTTRTCGSTT